MMDTKDMNTDELLCAYIDGELDAQQADEITARLAAEPELMQRLERLRGADEDIRKLMENIDKLPMPESVLDTIASAGRQQAENVVQLQPRRRLPFLQTPVAIAASVALVAGFIAGNFLRSTPAPGPGIDAVATGVIGEDTALHALLEAAPSGAPRPLAANARAELVLSFRDGQGDYCRQLRIDSDVASTHGVACRRGDTWQLEAMAYESAGSGQYQQAGSAVPEAIDDTVTNLLGDGNVLSADEENALISADWKKPGN